MGRSIGISVRMLPSLAKGGKGEYLGTGRTPLLGRPPDPSVFQHPAQKAVQLRGLRRIEELLRRPRFQDFPSA